MRIIKKIKQRGFFNLVFEILNRIVPESILRCAVMDILELDVDSAIATQPSEEILVENIGADEAKRKLLQQATWNNVPPSELQKHYGYLACLSGPAADKPDHLMCSDFVGGLWVATGEFPETTLGFRLMFQPRQAWIYAAYVDQAIRGKRIYQRTLAVTCKDLDQQGWNEILVAVAPWNKASRYVHEKHSKQKHGRIVAIRFLKFAAVFRMGNIEKSSTFTSDYIERPIKVSIQPDLKACDLSSRFGAGYE